jgi:hypothetical protein
LQSSVAVHLLEMEATAKHELGVVTSELAMVGEASQASAAVMEPVALTAVLVPHWTVWLMAADVSMMGAVVSRTVMVCVEVAVRPQTLVKDQVRVMTLLHEVPVWDSEAETTTGEELSGQIGSAVTVAAGGTVAPHSRSRLEGTPLRVGGFK